MAKVSRTSRIQLLRIGDSCRVAFLSIAGPGYVPGDLKAYNARGIVGGTSGKGGMNFSTIEGCRLSGWNTTAIDLLANSSHNVIRNNSISNSGWEGIYLAQYCDSNLVEGNAIKGCRRNAIDVVGSYNVIRGNDIQDIGLDSLTLSWDTDGILLYSRRGTTGVVQGNRIEENSIANAFNGITVHAAPNSDATDCVVRDNTIAHCRRFGIRIAGLPRKPDPRVSDILVDGNVVGYCDSSGIILERIPREVSVTGNYIFSNRHDGIEITSIPHGVRDVTISGNTILDSGSRAIGIDPLARHIVVGDNFISGKGDN